MIWVYLADNIFGTNKPMSIDQNITLNTMFSPTTNNLKPTKTPTTYQGHMHAMLAMLIRSQPWVWRGKSLIMMGLPWGHMMVNMYQHVVLLLIEPDGTWFSYVWRQLPWALLHKGCNAGDALLPLQSFGGDALRSRHLGMWRYLNVKSECLGVGRETFHLNLGLNSSLCLSSLWALALCIFVPTLQGLNQFVLCCWLLSWWTGPSQGLWGSFQMPTLSSWAQLSVVVLPLYIVWGAYTYVSVMYIFICLPAPLCLECHLPLCVTSFQISFSLKAQALRYLRTQCPTLSVSGPPWVFTP